jgi:hypothetical protein
MNLVTTGFLWSGSNERLFAEGFNTFINSLSSVDFNNEYKAEPVIYTKELRLQVVI